MRNYRGNLDITKDNTVWEKKGRASNGSAFFYSFFTAEATNSAFLLLSSDYGNVDDII
jgi:hypothetical protein